MRTYHDTRLLTFRGGNWIQRGFLALAGVAFILITFFFVTVAVIVGTFVALGIGARLWWAMRKLRAQAKASEALEGEFTVVERSRARQLEPEPHER